MACSSSINLLEVLSSDARGRLRTGLGRSLLDLEAFSDDNPLSDRECETHRIRIFLVESSVDKPFDLIP